MHKHLPTDSLTITSPRQIHNKKRQKKRQKKKKEDKNTSYTSVVFVEN